MAPGVRSASVAARAPGAASARSVAMRDQLGLARHLEDAVAERLQIRIVGRAGDRALVVALHEHDRLPHGERRVPAKVAHRAARALLVARDQLVARRKALTS